MEDSSPACSRSSAAVLSNGDFLLCAQLREFYLRKPDWPVVCPTCHCIVMKSYMHLHCSYIRFCKRSSLANDVAGGSLSTHRFAWYPGNPRAHLFSVGKWTVITILALHANNFEDVASLRESFLPRALLFSYRLPKEVNDAIIGYLADYTSVDLAFLGELLSARRYDVAQWTVKARLRNHIRRFQSNLLNI